MSEPFMIRSRGTRSRRGRLLIHLLVTALLGVALLSVGVVSGLAADQTIEASGSPGSYHWQPSSASVSSGGSVEFKNSTAVSHSVAWESGPETPSCPGVPSTGQGNWSGSCTFTQSGEYKFHCTIHPVEMQGTITVTGGPSKPVVSTGSATEIKDTEAKLNGTVNPSGQATSFRFKYGTSTSYGQLTPEESAGEGTTAVSKSATITGLLPSTTYHFKIVATNVTGTTEGSDGTFTTTGPPTATTSPATAVGGREATLAGSVNPRGHQTTYYFKYGNTTLYGQETTHKTVSGTTTINLSEPVTGLAPETTYHFQLVAENESGTTMGADQQFTTFGKPVVTTGQATGITDLGATLGGSVNAEAQETTYHFNYGTTEAYGQETAPKSAGKGTTSVSASAAVTGLAPETTYHFQLVAENESGTTSGTDHTFTTEGTASPPPPPPSPPPPPLVPIPDTTITSKPRAKSPDRTPTVKFTATVAGASYMCSIDSKAFKACRSPFTVPSLKPGRHRIRVMAVAGGVADPTPASCSFKVIAKTKKKHKRKSHRR